MPRKQMFEGGTKNRIMQVGREMFFEYGYDGTGVRAVMKRVGADVGAFYYYYTSKDELFNDVMAHYFAPYREDLDRLSKEAETAPYHALLRLFVYLTDKAHEYKALYSANMHRMVTQYICEATERLVEPYIEKSVRLLAERGACLAMDAKLTAAFIAHGVGTLALRAEEETDALAEGVRPALDRALGFDSATSKKVCEQEPAAEGQGFFWRNK